MRPDTLGFAGNTLDRAANHRSDSAWLAARRADPTSCLVRLSGDRAVVVVGHVGSTPASAESESIFLGIDDKGSAWFAAEGGEGGTDLRSIAVQGLVPSGELGLLAQARSLLAWHERHRFCSNCGAPTAIADGGYRRHCEACNGDHFPRTDPVVIMVITRGEACLLGRQPTWAKGMYSALAGFVEPGETIEDAARREVFEEAGIRVGAVRYLKSQPWPFPSSLMIGVIGASETETIVVDGNELQDARWFGHAELALMLAGTHPTGLSCPPPMAIANHLIVAALGLETRDEPSHLCL